MTVPLIPRKVLFGNPDRANVRVSPDGAYISFLAPRDGVLNVWVAPRDLPQEARPVTADTGRGIRFYGWLHTNRHILYLQDKNGDENWHIYRVDVNSLEVMDLTPFDDIYAQPLAISPAHPDEIMVGLNNRVPEWHDVHRINIHDGTSQLVEQNEGYAEFAVNDDYQVVAAYRSTPDGGAETFLKSNGAWTPWETIGQEDLLTTAFAGFDKTGRKLYMHDSRGRNTSALVVKDLETGSTALLAEEPQADINDVIYHPMEKTVQAASFVYDRKRWTILDAAIEPDLVYLRTVESGEVEIISRSLDDRHWIVSFVGDDQPVHFYYYDREQRQARFLFSNRKDLESYTLARMVPKVIQSRDGLDLVLYYTLPVGSDSNGDNLPDHPLPMVFVPHGGPWHRDFWGFNTWHQWLANRGYAVMNVNFRSSTGLGKAFTNAGDREWGGKVMEDQVDAVQWAIAQGIADPQKVAVMGGSFGGYSTLAGLTLYPELYACGVDLVGPSNLITLLESMPPYWKPMIEMFTSRVGDHRTEEGRALLKKHSPLTYTDRIRRPLLIGQGANDPRVKQAESDQIVKAMQEKAIPVTYALYPDEGHGFARPENNLSFNAIAEAFLAECLGGRFQPIEKDFEGSSLQVLTGAEGVPGLSEALTQSP